MPEQPDYYHTLGIMPSADEAQIRSAYRALAKRYHPDRVPAARQEWARDVMARLNTAYEVLSDPQRREQYDRQHGYAWDNARQDLSSPGETIWHTRRVRERSRRDRMARWRAAILSSATILGLGLLLTVVWGRWFGWDTLAVRCAWVIVFAVSLCLILAAVKLTEL